MNERTTKDQQPQFGIEQEYMIYTSIGTTHSWPLNWPVGGYPSPMGEYYSSVGTKTCFGRVLAEIHARFCLYSGILIAGINAEAVAS